MRHFTRSRIFVMSGMLVLAACGSSGSGNKSQGSGTTNQVGTSSTVRSGTSAGPGSTAGVANGTVTAEVAAAVQQAHTAERTALATYENVVAKFGDRNPFVNVIESERQHVATVAKVAADHSITLSTASVSVSANAAPATFGEACTAGVTTERQTIAMYDQLLPKVAAYADITTAFTSLRQSSQDNHLVAFQRCS